MQHVNFLLVSMALIVAGFGASIQAHRPGVAAAVAFAGCAIAICFWRLDVRTRELIKAGEAPLTVLQERLAARVGVGELRLVAKVETPSARFSAYSVVIRALVGIFVVGFVTAGLYAAISVRADDRPKAPVPTRQHIPR